MVIYMRPFPPCNRSHSSGSIHSELKVPPAKPRILFTPRLSEIELNKDVQHFIVFLGRLSLKKIKDASSAFKTIPQKKG